VQGEDSLQLQHLRHAHNYLADEPACFHRSVARVDTPRPKLEHVLVVQEFQGQRLSNA
jgi:hypothetical protein